MRGGLDDALDKLARRDELRRRATGEATGTPPAVTELVEAVAAVVAHNPQLGVTVGVEGAGDPLLLHFYYGDGQVQVNAENAVSAQPASPAPRHADFEVEAEVEEPYSAPPASEDDQERFGPATVGHPSAAEDRYYNDDADTAERRYGNLDGPPPGHDVGEDSRDLGARLRDLGMATTRGEREQPPHPFAATPPPPVPPQTGPSLADYDQPDYNTTRRINPEHYQAPVEPRAAERIPQQAPPPEQRGGMPSPLPHPIPLKVERPEETEMAARRLAALLRDDPTLLNQPPD
ncbi:MAG: hypothetical protein ABW022_04705 [Actinoplanes sp.]